MLASCQIIIVFGMGTHAQNSCGALVLPPVQGQLGKPKTQEKALERFISNLSQDMVDYFRKELYKRFFQNAPSGHVPGGILGLWVLRVPVCASRCVVCCTKIKETTKDCNPGIREK